MKMWTQHNHLDGNQIKKKQMKNQHLCNFYMKKIIEEHTHIQHNNNESDTQSNERILEQEGEKMAKISTNIGTRNHCIIG